MEKRELPKKTAASKKTVLKKKPPMKVKKIKLEPPPKIHKRLFKKWSEAVRKRAGFRCEICGRAAGEVDDRSDEGKKIKIDAHHIDGKKFTSVLRFNPMNGIALCTNCHKFDKNSAHNSTIWFYEAIKAMHNDRLDYIKVHRYDPYCGNGSKGYNVTTYREWLYSQEKVLDAVIANPSGNECNFTFRSIQLPFAWHAEKSPSEVPPEAESLKTVGICDDVSAERISEE
jgi:hypothetical protein